MLKGYFFVHNFSNLEKIIFELIKVVPHVKDWWDTYYEKNPIEETNILGAEPTWEYFLGAIKE